jgi:hypothetical protein
MSLKLGKPKMPPSEPRKDEEREMREAVVQDADKTEDEDRDLVHGDEAPSWLRSSMVFADREPRSGLPRIPSEIRHAGVGLVARAFAGTS